MQTRLESFAESTVNVAIGFGISLAGQWLIFPAVGLSVSIGQNIWIGVGFTAISLARQYVIRRWFNGRIRFTQ